MKNINWSAPWLAFWRERGEPIAQRILAGESAPDALASPRLVVAVPEHAPATPILSTKTTMETRREVFRATAVTPPR